MRKCTGQATGFVAHNSCGDKDLIVGESRIGNEVVDAFLDLAAQSWFADLIKAVYHHKGLPRSQGELDQRCETAASSTR